MAEPEPPQNVRAVMADGREIPLELVYTGFEDGTHRWIAAWTLPEPPASIRVDVLPAHTSVGVLALH